jgi:thiamine-phosphate pyrophosphorylase
MSIPRVYLITDRRVAPLLPAVEAALRGLPPGTAVVQLRERDLPGAELLGLARELAAACARHGQSLLVNDRIDVALAAGAAGVHLPSAGIPPGEARRWMGPRALIGVSCHGPADVARAREGGADFATFGPVYDTPSKRSYGPPVGLTALQQVATLGLPLVGLGGISEENSLAVWQAGAAGVAAIRAWLSSPDPGAAVRQLLVGAPAAQAR